MVIRGGSFYPRPNVDSQGVLLELRDDAAVQNVPSCFYPLVRQLFSARRKTVKNNLAGFFASRIQTGTTAMDATAEALEKCALNGLKRAEELALDDFLALAKVIVDMEV
jgi:16S rRNA (adenine1518-N6/adenine1519-N6)-dimethyltransferase